MTNGPMIPLSVNITTCLGSTDVQNVRFILRIVLSSKEYYINKKYAAFSLFWDALDMAITNTLSLHKDLSPNVHTWCTALLTSYPAIERSYFLTPSSSIKTNTSRLNTFLTRIVSHMKNAPKEVGHIVSIWTDFVQCYPSVVLPTTSSPSKVTEMLGKRRARLDPISEDGCAMTMPNVSMLAEAALTADESPRRRRRVFTEVDFDSFMAISC